MRQSWSAEQCLNIASHVLCGLEYLHQRFICHADLKSGNIVVGDLSTGSAACIVDFGCSWVDRDDCRPFWHRYLDNGRVHLGAFAYRAPEVFLGSPHWGRAADIWALGGRGARGTQVNLEPN